MCSGAAVGGVSTRKSLFVARIGREWNISARFFPVKVVFHAALPRFFYTVYLLSPAGESGIFWD
jgi:hypothetical protein